MNSKQELYHHTYIHYIHTSRADVPVSGEHGRLLVEEGQASVPHAEQEILPHVRQLYVLLRQQGRHQTQR